MRRRLQSSLLHLFKGQQCTANTKVLTKRYEKEERILPPKELAKCRIRHFSSIQFCDSVQLRSFVIITPISGLLNFFK